MPASTPRLKKESRIIGVEGCQAVFANPVPQRGKRMLMTIFWIGAIIIKPH